MANYWSSSESSNRNSWLLNTSRGNRSYGSNKANSYAVRSFQLIELSADGTVGSDGVAVPKVGDVMYADKSRRL